MEETKFGLSHAAIEKIRSVIQGHPAVERTLLYGSRAKGNFRPGSDIDLTLVAPKITTTELLKIATEIDDLMLPYKVDLSLLHQIENKDLVDHIHRVGVDFLIEP